MKWLIFSDSHGDVSTMRSVVLREKPDRILHLGDVVRDAQRLQDSFPDIPLDQVRGNCDVGSYDVPEEKELFFLGHRVWLLHGHGYGVKMGLGLMLSEARGRGAEVVLFGHTHKALCDRDGPMWIVNPGSIGASPQGTYAVMEERRGELYCRTALAVD